ncbi:MAG: radical SAM protein [Chloroflexi bacterium]|nr:radical SAM protein [Chloroflexota bacterium]
MSLPPDGEAAPTGDLGWGAVAPVGLYLHIPFCVSHCPYCDFVVVAGREARGPANRIASFVRALEQELDLRADALDRHWGPPGTAARPLLDTVYLGGGTPSLLPTNSIARLLALVRSRFGVADGAEVTLEVNPGADERGDAGAIRAAGVTRLSIGAQSLDPKELRTLGRRHSPDDVAETVRAARASGLASVSLDLLYDIPGATLESWAATLDTALALVPDHLSLYALTLDDPDAEGITGPGGDHLPVSAGARRWRDQARRGQDDDRAAAMYELADRRLAAAGFAWYEISNWARPGHRSRHNLAYWEGRAWEAAGPGAHAFDGRTRRWNAARLDGYIAALTPSDGSAPRLPPGLQEPVTASGREAESAILALRTSMGLPPSALDRPALGPTLTWALEAGLLEPTRDDRLVLTLAGRLLSNEVFVRLV